MGWVTRSAFSAALSVFSGAALAEEVVFLKNGSVVYGSVTTGQKTVTIRTPYGRLVVPKSDVVKILYEGAGEEALSAAAPPPPSPSLSPPPPPPARSAISLDIRGRSFWYAFQDGPQGRADPRIRLRLSLAGTEIAELVDAKPDTVDGSTSYNSFTFSPTDSQVVRTAEGFSCNVGEAVDGKVVLALELPADYPLPGKEVSLEMLYQINDGTAELPRWLDVVIRPVFLDIEQGKETYLIIEQDSSGLDYSGFLRKRMKNVETFTVTVRSAELRERSPGPPSR